MAAMQGWGLAGGVLFLEALQRSLALDNRARDLLVGGALSAGLVPALLPRLDWRKCRRSRRFILGDLLPCSSLFLLTFNQKLAARNQDFVSNVAVLKVYALSLWHIHSFIVIHSGV